MYPRPHAPCLPVYLGRQAGKLAFTEPFLCPRLQASLQTCAAALGAFLVQVRNGGSGRLRDLPRSTQPIRSRAAGDPGLLDPKAHAASPDAVSLRRAWLSAHASFSPREAFQTFAALISAGGFDPPPPLCLLVSSFIALFSIDLSI